MYLSRIRLWNFRRFGSPADLDLDKPNLDVPLKTGLNVLVGENDSGKSAIVDAVKLVLGTHSLEWNRVTDDDFYRESQRLRIELTFDGMADQEAKNVIEWLGWTGEGENVRTSLCVNYDVRRTSEKILPSEVRAGADSEGSPLSAEAREYLKCTYLRPLRDAEKELVPKRDSRLSRIFQGHPAFKGKEDSHHLVTLFNKFNQEIENYFDGIDSDGNDLPDDQGKALKREVDAFVGAFCSNEKTTEIGVAPGSLKSVLERLILSIKDELNPGLGTLNRLFMATELVHLSKKDWHGLRLGLIEELEAHLHPQAQMQVVEELQDQTGIQLILTTHSPNLTSKLKLESLIICSCNDAFPMGSDFTKLDPDDYKFLEWFLDVTKSNLFFAKGIIIVEGWAEELLIPALARKMKACDIISRDLTECGVSVVNVGGTALLRYSRIFQRQLEPFMRIPVSVVCDLDVREYEKKPKLDPQGRPELDARGKIVHEYVKLPADSISAVKVAGLTDKAAHFDSFPVKAFVAPHWTLEYSLLKSDSLQSVFIKAFKTAHPMVDEGEVEIELAGKLINGGLRKTEIAYELAHTLEEDNKKGRPQIRLREDDGGVGYLMNAIKYACEY